MVDFREEMLYNCNLSNTNPCSLRQITHIAVYSKSTPTLKLPMSVKFSVLRKRRSNLWQ